MGYSLSRGPSKIVASTRRGTPRAFENSHQTERVDSEATMSSVARPVFNHSHNGRMRNQPRANSSDGITYMSPSHQEAVQFLRESWNKILRDYRSGSAEAGGPEVYRQREQHPAIARTGDGLPKSTYQGF
eukprot:TRINITY_DN89314_c0_g1_i1.p1 TRINITY_DN89314_c0_g1~~TRINITY_DN89314_c0_g1_i1.p1  ORF type:complete len:130 (+),score=19.46 TRINITY_DN89314_c0_g1_i1:56-445(+)